MPAIELTLPWCPTINHYYINRGAIKILSATAKDFRRTVGYIAKLTMKAQNMTEPFQRAVRLEVNLFPPDRRRRDIDNVCKGILDSLQHAGVYANDYQVDELYIKRRIIDAPNGRIEIKVIPLEGI